MMHHLHKLTEEEIEVNLAKPCGWKREGDSIVKEFVFSGFTEATQFIGRIADPANQMNHHPDLQLKRYKRVKVTLTTHSAGGLTQNDFDLAAQIEIMANSFKLSCSD